MMHCKMDIVGLENYIYLSIEGSGLCSVVDKSETSI